MNRTDYTIAISNTTGEVDALALSLGGEPNELGDLILARTGVEPKIWFTTKHVWIELADVAAMGMILDDLAALDIRPFAPAL